MPPDRRERAERLIDRFEQRLAKIVNENRIPRRYIRPSVTGSVICGEINQIYFVGYIPQLGMPTVYFTTLVGTGPPSTLAFHSWVMDETGQDLAVVDLFDSWLGLSDDELNAICDAKAMQVIQSELSRNKVNTSMIPINPIFGPNIYPTQDRLVFTLMPFTPALTQIYISIIKPSIEAKGMVSRRADDITSNNAIMHDVWRSICEARFIVADLTDRNSNVMYELGIAHTIGKEVIIINQSGPDAKFPFDIAHMRIISYDDTATGGSRLKHSLERTIDSVLVKLSSQSSIR